MRAKNVYGTASDEPQGRSWQSGVLGTCTVARSEPLKYVVGLKPQKQEKKTLKIKGYFYVKKKKKVCLVNGTLRKVGTVF